MKGSSYIQLPKELSHHMKGLINIKTEDNQCFRWCYIGRLNPRERNPQRITKQDKILANVDGIVFPVTVKQYNKIEKRNCSRIKFGYETKQMYHRHIHTYILYLIKKVE